MTDTYRDLIITAASESYRPQLLALLGSLRCNWPNHPPVRVYDMGLREGTGRLLREAGFDVRVIPPFVPHWRKHYTWKPWCMNDASAERLLWLDAGCCVLRPLPEIFDTISQQGYFALPNYEPLEVEASEEACEGCGVAPEFRVGKVSITAAVFGFRRGSIAQHVVQEALRVAQTERYIKASKPWHRWEQAILSLLMHRDISPLVLCDGTIYFYEDLAAKFKTHSIWAARRGMHYKDKRFFASCLVGPVSPHLPRASHKLTFWYQGARRPKVAFGVVKRLLFGKPKSGLMDGIK
jgi:hypothetical protein